MLALASSHAIELLRFRTAFDFRRLIQDPFGMKQDDSRIEEILIKMQQLLKESRLLKKSHDKLAEEYFELKREFDERTARRRTAAETGACAGIAARSR
jgi:hypothetical protein